MDEAVRKLVKSNEKSMQYALLLQHQMQQNQSENGYKKRRKERTRCFIQDGGSLTVAEVRQQEEEQRRELEREAQPRPRRPQKCSNCGGFGHNRRQCTRG